MLNNIIKKQKGFTRTPTLALLQSVFNKIKSSFSGTEKKESLAVAVCCNKNTTPKLVSGFTLVEMLVAIAVFMIVVTSAVGALYSIMDANRKAQAIKNVVNNVSFALESISKDMRMGKGYKCYLLNGTEEPCQASGYNMISYISNQDLNGDDIFDDVVWYQFDPIPTVESGGGNIQKRYQKIVGGPIIWESLTAPESTVKIKNMTFYVSSNNKKVFITVEGESGTKASLKTDFSLQTTITQRSQE